MLIKCVVIERERAGEDLHVGRPEQAAKKVKVVSEMSSSDMMHADGGGRQEQVHEAARACPS